MASVENFYWILFENLLSPVGLPCRYYYPFGTTKYISRSEFHSDPENPRNAASVLFHYDQEPIYEEDNYDIEDGVRGNYLKHPRILANSEISALKKEMCRRYQLLDWYFFYHGFAALDWYRDAKYIPSHWEITNSFSSLNHLIKNKRSYRMSLIARLSQRDLLDKGNVSFFGDYRDCIEEINDIHTRLTQSEKDLIKKELIDRQIKPMFVDSQHVDGNFSARLGAKEYKTRQSSFLHIVNETIFYDKKKHLTEKVFQPIVYERPFILTSSPGNLEYLRSYGFKTFGNWIDETYDTIDDDSQRLDCIADEIERIVSKPIEELQRLLLEMKPILQFNKAHFYGEFRKIIVDELVDNFDKCLDIWNNGRVDGRTLARHPNLDFVKKILY